MYDLVFCLVLMRHTTKNIATIDTIINNITVVVVTIDNITVALSVDTTAVDTTVDDVIVISVL